VGFPLPSGAIGVPTSFAVDGEQYVAVTTGWDLDAQAFKTASDEVQGTKRLFPRAARCWFSSFVKVMESDSGGRANAGGFKG